MTEPGPSVPYHLRRQTGPQASVGDREREEQESAAIAAILREPAGLTVDGILRLLDITQRRAVIAAKQDDKLMVDLRVGAIESTLKTISASITGITGKFAKSIRFWRIVSTAAIVAATAIGAAAGAFRKASIGTAHAEDPSVAAMTPEAGELGSKLEERLADSERRHDATDAALQQLRDALEANTRAVLGIAARLETPEQVRVPAENLPSSSGHARKRP